ncbi:MAG: hypothetical protein B6D58_06445 [candidate division Zixibacteria bacterium 4484_95]|nr:MAG: hypothetical protein B6D58_06445 [candidate division Zixibacteria bacterium 4484_95]
MKKVILLAAIACLLVMGLAIGDEEKTFDTNTVYFENVTAKPGESFAVKVNIANVDTLSGMQVPIFFRSDKIKLQCDSVSFTGSRCEYFMFNDIKIPMVCEKCKAEYDKVNAPPKKAGICDKCGGKLVHNGQVVYFSLIDNVDPKLTVDPLYPGDGLVATIYFTAPKDCPKGTVKLTRGMIPHPTISYIYTVWNPLGTELDCVFKEGEIKIK